MNYQQGNMEIDDIADGQAQVTIHDNTSAARTRSVVVFHKNREAAAQALAGDEFRVMSGSIVGNCPACKQPRLAIEELGRIRCTNFDCDEPNAAMKALVDPDFRCRCGTPKTENNPKCGWHAREGSRRGWVIVTAEEMAALLSDKGKSDSRPHVVAGECPSCKSSQLVLNEFGYVVCKNTQCAIPTAAGETLVDSDLSCRCGKLKTEESQTIGKPPHPTCSWHEERAERGHLGWTIQPVNKVATLLSDRDTLDATIHELTEELRLSVEYVGIDVLQPWPGWGWYDALKKHMPQFDEWLAKMPSRGTAHLASEANKHDDIDNVLATLHFAKMAVDTFEDDDWDDPVDNRAHIEQLDRLINTCERVRQNAENDDIAPPADDDALLGVVPANQTQAYPYTMGDYITLGPQIFADAGETVINWKGENYYPRPVKPRREDTVEKQVRDLAEVFKEAWHAADERGETGTRTQHGIRAVLSTLDDTMFGQRVNVSDVEPGDHILAYFLGGRLNSHDSAGDDESKYFLVEGQAYSTPSGRLYVGSNQIRDRNKSRAGNLGEVRRLSRAEPAEPTEPEPDPVEVQSVVDVIYAAHYTSKDGLISPYTSPTDLARELVRRNVKKVPDGS